MRKYLDVHTANAFKIMPGRYSSRLYLSSGYHAYIKRHNTVFTKHNSVATTGFAPNLASLRLPEFDTLGHQRHLRVLLA